MAFIVPGIFGLIGALLIALSGWLWLRDPPRRLCPGPNLRWPTWLLPLWLAYRPRCAYDLCGHAPDAAGVIVCPECGRRVLRHRQKVRSPRAWRPGRLGCTLIAAGMLVYRYPPLAATTVVQHTPTDILLRGEGFLGVGTPLEVRAEIRRRALDHQLTDEQTCAFVRVLVNDLRDDHLAGNARDALQRLAIFGIFCAEPLIEALHSGDEQQRIMAARALRQMPAGFPASEPLLRVTVEDLRSDDRGGNCRAAINYLHNHLEEARPLLIEALASTDDQQRRHALRLLRLVPAAGPALETLLKMSLEDLLSGGSRRDAQAAFVFLLAHAEHAEPLLGAGIAGDDAQQRLLCAAVAGCAGRTGLMPQATPILAGHLADNDIGDDAILAARALYGFGQPVLPLLEPLRRSIDEQQRQAIEYIVRRMTTSESPAKLQRELPMARLTLAAQDALSVSPERLDMPRIPKGP